LADAAEIGAKLGEHEDVARRCKVLHDTIKLYQDAITSLEKVSLSCKCFILTYINNIHDFSQGTHPFHNTRSWCTVHSQWCNLCGFPDL
jgi:HD superfamily phosphodiesterase